MIMMLMLMMIVMKRTVVTMLASLLTSENLTFIGKMNLNFMFNNIVVGTC